MRIATLFLQRLEIPLYIVVHRYSWFRWVSRGYSVLSYDYRTHFDSDISTIVKYAPQKAV